MRIIKIILVIVAVYFIRRFIQMYRVMKSIQEQQQRNMRENQARQQKQDHAARDQSIINADFKVMD
jgi:heme exporter protein D